MCNIWSKDSPLRLMRPPLSYAVRANSRAMRVRGCNPATDLIRTKASGPHTVASCALYGTFQAKGSGCSAPAFHALMFRIWHNIPSKM
jgi:hypothetical protein